MGRMCSITAMALLCTGSAATFASAASGLIGDWKTPGGSIVRAEQCDAALCLTIVKISPNANGTTDALNPDSALKGRALCGVRIGQGFKPDGANSATDGKIYDPESGKTYSSKITLDGNKLKLRGFLGLSMFGRTEVWTRSETVQACGRP